MKEKALDFYHQYKLYIYPAVVTLCSLVLIIFVIVPQLMSYLDSRTAYASVVSRSQALEVKAQELTVTNDTALRRDMNIILNVLPVGRDFPSVIGMVQTLTSKHLFELTSLQFGNAVEEGSKDVSPTFLVKIEITGFQESLQSLLKDFENAVPISKVESIEIASTPEDSSINAIVTLKVFYSDIPKSLGSLEAPLPKISDEEKSLINKYSGLIIQSGGAESTSPRGKSNPFE